MSRKFIVTIATLIVIAVSAGGAILIARGYTFSPTEKRIVGTGIITVTSEPDAASVYVDGHLTTATDATISSLSPKKYTVRVIKEGFIPWEKEVEVREGLVTELEVTLFPAIPTMYPLTFTGVVNPVLSPDESKLAFIVPTGKKAGVWVWTMVNNQPIAFARGAEPHQIGANVTADFSKATLKWSPDSKNVLATVANNNYLLESEQLNNDPRDITPILSVTLKEWEEDLNAQKTSIIESIADKDYQKVASGSANLRWSPDETKFMVGEKEVKVYNLEEKKEYNLPPAKTYHWLPNSTHIILVEDQAISIVDADGTNKAVIYAGNFLNDFVFAWPDSSRLVIMSTFPTPTASEPNLYGINLK